MITTLISIIILGSIAFVIGKKQFGNILLQFSLFHANLSQHFTNNTITYSQPAKAGGGKELNNGVALSQSRTEI